MRKVKHLTGCEKQRWKLEFELDGIPYKVSSTSLRSSRTPAFNEDTRISLLVIRRIRSAPFRLPCNGGLGRG